MSGYESYVICTSPRSGSTLLCHLLRATGVAGWPGSHFHDTSLDGWLNAYGLIATDYPDPLVAIQTVVEAAKRHGRRESSVFGLRLQGQSRAFFLEQLGRLSANLDNDRARIQAAFGKTAFVYLTREDKLDQAISFVKARQTGLWHRAPDGTEIERLSAPKEPVFDRQEIASEMARFQLMDEDWANWFQTAGLEPLRLTYEQLASAPHDAVTRVLDHLGVDTPKLSNSSVPVARLADALSLEWKSRYLAEAGSS